MESRILSSIWELRYFREFVWVWEKSRQDGIWQIMCWRHFPGRMKRNLMEEAYDRAAAAVAEILTDGPDKAMNDFN